MSFASTVSACRDQNLGKYSREVFDLSSTKNVVYVTTNFEIGSTDALHYHERPHISFVLNGGIIDKRGGSEIETHSGELMFFHAGEPHQSIYTAFPAKSITLELEPSFLKENLLTEEMLQSAVNKDPAAKFALLKIYKELLIKDDLSESSIEMLMLGLTGEKDIYANACPRWMDDVLTLLNDLWDEPLSLKQISAAVGVHPITISKHFPRYVSCTMGEYRRRLKIERALAIVKRSTISLTEVSHKCGFSDQSHFTRTFKQMTGFLPRQYRSL